MNIHSPQILNLTTFHSLRIKLRFDLRSGGIELISLTSNHLKPQKTECQYEKTFKDIEGTVRINGQTIEDIHNWIAG